jgi:hypothetical protein
MRSWWTGAHRRLRVLRQLRRPGDVLLFARILFFAAAIPALLRLKLSRLEALLEPKRTLRTTEPATARKVVTYLDYVLQAGSPLVRGGCLTRGLTLYFFLRRAGLDVALCFGMGKVEGRFTGHCWLVKDGEPFLEMKDPRPLFAEVYVMPRGGLRSLNAR